MLNTAAPETAYNAQECKTVYGMPATCTASVQLVSVVVVQPTTRATDEIEAVPVLLKHPPPTHGERKATATCVESVLQHASS